MRVSKLQSIAILALAWSPPGVASWSATGKLNTAREQHTATLLADGRVLVIGGLATTFTTTSTGWTWYADGIPKNSVEIYDPGTGTWRSTGGLNVARFRCTATLLPTGQVLVTGGYTSGETTSAELYDPATEGWRYTGSLIRARADHTATLLPNGIVLIAGGAQRGESVYRSELYDPATEMWSPSGSTTTVSSRHTATLLPDGKVLAIGNRNCTKVAELYDPASGSWSATTAPPVYGCAESATLLASGEVLVTDGAKAQLYDPASGQWRPTGAPSLVGARHTLTLLPNGQVLAAGGQSDDFSVDGAELYDPATGRWAATTPLTKTRATHTATPLGNGKVLIAAGFDGSCCDWRYTLDSADLFDLGTPESRTVTSVSAASYRVMGLARDSIAAAFGSGLASSSVGSTVKIKDSAGVEWLAPIFFVSPTQISYQVPAGTAAGLAAITITSGDGTVSTGMSVIRDVSPSLFTANADGQGVAAGFVRRLRADGSSLDEPIATFDEGHQKFIPRPINLGPPTDRVRLILSGTGIRFRSSLSTVIATIGGIYTEVLSAEAQSGAAGVDRVEVVVLRGVVGRGEVDVLLTVDGQVANPVRINIQ